MIKNFERWLVFPKNVFEADCTKRQNLSCIRLHQYSLGVAFRRLNSFCFSNLKTGRDNKKKWINKFTVYSEYWSNYVWVKEWKSGQVKLCVRCGSTKKYSNRIEYKMKKPSWNFLKVPYCANSHARKQLIWVISLYPDGKHSYKFPGGSMILRTIMNFIILCF